jgi:hypothetical protein
MDLNIYNLGARSDEASIVISLNIQKERWSFRAFVDGFSQAIAGVTRGSLD